MTASTLARRRRIVLAALTLGVVVMVAFDRWFTLLAGVGLMLGAVVAGLFLIAVPGGFLDHDRGEGDGPGADRGAADAPGTPPDASVDPGAAGDPGAPG